MSARRIVGERRLARVAHRMELPIGTVPLDEIEKAGGSLRCCVAEIF